MSVKAYCKLIERTGAGCYYLWGPIQNALLMEFASGKKDLIAQICTRGSLTRYRRMPEARKDMLIQVLTIAGRGDKHKYAMERLLRQIMRTRPSPWLSVTRRKLVEARKVVAEVARELQMDDLLRELLLDRNEDVRRTAVRSTFYLWREDESVGMNLLRQMGDPRNISPWVVPSRRQIQSCLELSLSILFNSYGREKITAALLEVWAGILGKVLWHQASHDNGEGSSSGQTARVVRTALLRTAIRLILGIARNLEEERVSIYDVGEMKAFFKSSDDIQKPFGRLVKYLNPAAGSLKQPDIMADLKSIVTSRDVLSGYLLVCILAAHIMVRPAQTRAVIEELFKTAIEFEGAEPDGPGLPAIPMLIIALSSASDRTRKDKTPIDPETVELEEKIILEYQRRHNSVCEGRTGVKFIYSGLSSYPQYPKRLYGKVNRNVLDVFIEERAKNKYDGSYDPKKIRDYVVNVAVPGHPDYRDIGAILESLVPVLAIAFDEEEDLAKAQARFERYGTAKVERFMTKEKHISRKAKELVVFQECLVDALARIEVYAEEEVEVFMDEQGLPSEFQDRVRNKSSEEELATAVIGHGVFFVRDAILLNKNPDGPLAKIFRAWFKLTPECKSFADWISRGLMMILNALSGNELFELPSDATE